MARNGLAEEAAKKYLEELDKIRARRTRELFKIDWRDPTRYDLVLNTAKTTVETAAQLIAEVSQREEYRQTVKFMQAMKDLTITTRVEAVLIACLHLDISNLEVETRCGEVHVGGVILAESIKDFAADTVKIPGVTRVITHFVVTPSEHYLYGDGR
jgi:osmotically-inducible protein OsmY